MAKESSNNTISVLAVCVVHLLTFEADLDVGIWTIILPALGHPSLLCVLGSRLLVNLKEAGELGLNEGTNYRPDSFSETLSEMEFSERVAEGNDQHFVPLVTNANCHSP